MDVIICPTILYGGLLADYGENGLRWQFPVKTCIFIFPSSPSYFLEIMKG